MVVLSDVKQAYLLFHFIVNCLPFEWDFNYQNNNLKSAVLCLTIKAWYGLSSYDLLLKKLRLEKGKILPFLDTEIKKNVFRYPRRLFSFFLFLKTYAIGR